MKSLILFTVFGVCMLVVNGNEGWTKADEECVVKLQLNKEDIQKLNILDEFPLNNADFNKFLECTWTSEGTLEKDGKINWDAIYSFLNEFFTKKYESEPDTATKILSSIKAAINKCQSKYSSSPATPAEAHNCILNNVQ